eukprot:3948739-Prymnesium_polylepis.2
MPPPQPTRRDMSSSLWQFPAYDGVWTNRMERYTIPAQTTTYACQSLTFPTDQERHIVAFKPINVSKYNHHAIVHVCTDNAYFASHNAPQLCSYDAGTNTCPGESGGTCRGGSPLGETNAACSGLIWSWAVGMGEFLMPDAAGFRVGAGHISHVILEIHVR